LRILLYNPDNGVTRNFMPHLWMFLLQALTPPGHEVLLIDGNAQPMDEAQIAQYVRDQNIGLVGIGAMTRMIAKAYRIADAIRATGVPVVMGGPHVTELADEALGKDGGPRHADAVALGEADATWPQVIFIEPTYTDAPNMNDATDDHSPSSILGGQHLMLKVFNALVANQARWNRTVMILTYDEHGGFFDHVSPIAIPTVATPPAVYANFSSSGARVCTATIEGDPECIMHVGWAVDADGKSCVRANTQCEQVIVDESAVGLNGTATTRR